MSKMLAAFGGTALALVILDALWLFFAGPKIYRPIIGEILADKVNFAPAVVFYVLYVFGVTVLAVRPAIASDKWTEAAVLGVILGVVAYGTYDLTNQATLKVWATRITLIDIAWGAFLTAAGALAGFYASKLVSR
jgi:uncharacterized membrane protein